MRFIRNDDNELDYIELHPSDTVQSICEALQCFLDSNPLKCHSCNDNCCKEFPIRPDNVFMKQPSFFAAEKQKCNGNWFLKETLGFEDGNHVMPKKKTSEGNFFCYYGNFGKCEIYSNRPILCRLYTCGSVSAKWKELMNIIVDVYKDALEYEIAEQTVKSYGDRGKHTPYPGKTINPTLYACDYSVQLDKIILWANENGNDIDFFCAHKKQDDKHSIDT